MNYRVRYLIVRRAIFSIGKVLAEEGSIATSPPFKKVRYDEDYEYLRDPARQTDFLDAIKFIALTANGGWYLTFGGDIRERYEYYHNSLWE